MVQIEFGEGLESRRKGCGESQRVQRVLKESQKSQKRIPRESGDIPKIVRRRSNESQRGSRESQERVQRVLGEGPKRVEECPERVRRGSIGSQETVQRE